ncbi:MAG: type II secretion system GspH family protein [Elusimicrobia bacterium]|nr:type II secretion system GspH family protein [Elusimicrobiota bacterium]
MINKRAGFTLIELLVVVLIIGILASVAVPSYLKSVETTKADDAVSLVNMIGTTNKMYALDHSGSYIGTGGFATFPTAANTGCGPAPTPCNQNPANACTLVWCKYLADQNFGSKPYTFYACSPAGGACGASGGANATAGAKRKAGTYAAWGYAQDAQGVISSYGGAPAPTY